MSESHELPIGTGEKTISGINDPRILVVRERENGEALVKVEHTRIVRPSDLRDDIQTGDGSMMVRKSVADALIRAAESLPEGYGLVFIEGYRSFDDQLKLFKEEMRKGGNTEAGKFVSDPNVYSPHVTGGTVDVALVKIDGDTVSLCDVGNNTFEHDEQALTSYNNLTPEQSGNRKLLLEAMTAQGFTNYPFEFWHFSIGDRIDAFAKDTIARFGAIKLTKYG